jgi:hypothetical protein
MKRPGVFSLLTLLGVAAAGYVPLSAAERPPKKKIPAAPSAGWRAFRDPSTGKLREPTAEEARALSREVARKTAAPENFEVLVHPDGTKSVDLKGAFSMSLVARRRPDGSITYECRPAAAAERPVAAPGEK